MTKKVRVSFDGKSYDVDICKIPANACVGECVLQKSRMKPMYLLEKMKNKSRGECYSFFSNYTNQLLGGVLLSVKNEQSLMLNDEGRAILCEDCGDPFIVNNSIIKLSGLEKMYLKGIKRVEIKNCVIFNDVFINSNDKPIDVSIENCFVFGRIHIRGGDSPCSVSFYKTAIDQLKFSEKINAVSFSNVSLGSFILEDSLISHANMFWMLVESLQMYSSKIIEISKIQLDISVSNSARIPKKCVWKRYPIDVFSKNLDKKEKKEKMVESVYSALDFIKQNNSVNNISNNSRITYYRNNNGVSGPMKMVYFLFGGMIKPWVIVLWYIGIVALFAFFYCCCDNPFGVNEVNSFGKSIYFSTITMTTVGYGDIKPIGFAQFLASIEGILGVLFGGAFLVALTRRYFSR